ncbi:MAG: type II CAAX prenyl endopeptidase Rce1 family protein, partial [Planctomycetota bacterium]
TTLLQVGAWALIWALVRTVIGFTGDTLLIDASLPLDPLASTPGEELSLLGHVGLAMSGALQEELLFRAGLIGGLAWLLTPLRLQHTHAQLLLLLPAAAIFALAHTDVVNHYHVAQPFSWPLVIQHGLGGLLYGIVFIRQGLAVCTLSHGCYNGAVAFGLLDF